MFVSHLFQVSASFTTPLSSCYLKISHCLLLQCETPALNLFSILERPLKKSSILKITDTRRKIPPCSTVVWICRLTKDCSPTFNEDRFWRTTVPVWKVCARVLFVQCGLHGLHRTVNVLRKYCVCQHVSALFWIASCAFNYLMLSRLLYYIYVRVACYC